MRVVFFLLMAVSAGVLPAREVAITIDDLPRGGDREATLEDTRRMTEKLLKPFAEQQIPLIGFVNECRHSSTFLELLKFWKAAGAELGNHTCSHPDLNSTPVPRFEADIVRGETFTTALFGQRPRYFRYPFLHAGKDAATKKALASFLASRGYRIAPVTIDDSDWLFAAVYASALSDDDHALAQRLRDSYLQYMDGIFDFFERRSAEVAGHEIRQVLLIHANQLNADTMPDLLGMMRRREYRFITLDRALEDSAYKLPEEYVGPGGFSWIHRWSKTRGMAPKSEPDEPDWVGAAFKKLRARS